MSAKRRLPAYGRSVKSRLESGLRPIVGGGTIVVTTEWNYAAPFTRLVCSPEIRTDNWDFSYLRGVDVVVLVPHEHRLVGERLSECIRQAHANLVVLAVNPEASP